MNVHMDFVISSLLSVFKTCFTHSSADISQDSKYLQIVKHNNFIIIIIIIIIFCIIHYYLDKDIFVHLFSLSLCNLFFHLFALGDVMKFVSYSISYAF